MKVIKKDNYIYYISEVNGNNFCVSIENDSEILRGEIESAFLFNAPISYNDNNYDNFHICINVSNDCNLKCKYCFREYNSSTKPIDYDRAVSFISKIIKNTHAKRYIVDMTGSGEPLLQLNTILRIADFCIDLSKKIGIEIVPQIATNGTLLTPRVADLLKKHRILYGVSIDGDEIQHDSNRRYIDGTGTYQTIISNVEKIKDKELIGAAVTLNNHNIDLISIIESLIYLFPTISIKPLRIIDKEQHLSDSDFKLLLDNYRKLTDFLINKTLDFDKKYILSLLRGDDYFGKFIRRSLLNTKVNTRCDFGRARLSLAEDGNIYICPAAVGIGSFVVSKEDEVTIDIKLIDILLEKSRSKCDNCFAKYSCGGSCVVDNYYINENASLKNNKLCELNRALFLESIRFKCITAIQNETIFKSLVDFCKEKEDREQ